MPVFVARNSFRQDMSASLNCVSIIMHSTRRALTGVCNPSEDLRQESCRGAAVIPDQRANILCTSHTDSLVKVVDVVVAWLDLESWSTRRRCGVDRTKEHNVTTVHNRVYDQNADQLQRCQSVLHICRSHSGAANERHHALYRTATEWSEARRASNKHPATHLLIAG